MATLLTGVAVLVLATLVAIGGYLISDRLVPLQARQAHNDVAGFIYAFVGPLYAILLAFVVFVVWGYFNDARSAAAAEATAIYKVYSISRGLDAPFPDEIQHLTVAYGQSVIDEEWPAMRRGDLQSPQTRQAYVAIRDAVEAYSPTDLRQSDLYQQELANLEELAGTRNDRLLRAENVLHPALWLTLIVGAVVSIGYAYMFGIENRAAHAVMVGVLVFSIAGILYLISVIDRPYVGDLRVEPTAMRETVNIIQGAHGPP